MESLGRHALLDLYGCDARILNDPAYLQQLLKQTALDLETTIVEEVFHTFAPHGVSGVIVIAESHLAIHTWPEHGYAAVDLFTCSETTELSALADLLRERFHASHIEYTEKPRGLLPAERMRLQPKASAAT